nr:hypothetical protein [Escherichia coli]
MRQQQDEPGRFSICSRQAAVVHPAQLAQGHGQSVLARVAAELAQHQRGGDGALLDGV